jgi:hypothetical protein
MATPPSVSHTREERRSLALHEAIARELERREADVRRRAEGQLARLERTLGAQHRHVAQWRNLLALPLDALIAGLLDPSPDGCERRHITPFAGVLTAPQRTAVYRAFQAAEDA